MPESSAAVRHRSKNFYGRTPPTLPTSKTELDILIERHQFIRDSDEQNLSWEDALAKKTYDQLFKELAVCDLTRWKEGKVAMRWRTASEVIDGKGHFTCANLRCPHHEPGPKSPPRSLAKKAHSLSAFADVLQAQHSFIPLEDPGRASGRTPPESAPPAVRLQELQTSFGYVEHGVRKLAEIKLNLCKRCAKKMSSCSKRRARDRAPRAAIHPSPHKRELSDDEPVEREPCPERPAKIRRTGAR